MPKNNALSKDVVQTISAAAIAEYLRVCDAQRKKERAETRSNNLYNTRLLLKNYRSLCTYADNAVFEAEHIEDESVLEILDLMCSGERNAIRIDAIKKSVGRTKLMIEHIRVVLDIYEGICIRSERPEQLRKWRSLKALYIGDESLSMTEIAAQEFVTERTVQRDIEDAIEILTTIMFGVDGIKWA